MRRVWGCTPPNSAATEITYTARVRPPWSGRMLMWSSPPPRVAPGAAAAPEPDALAVVDPGRDPDLDLAGSLLDAAAPAGGARVVDDVAPAGALRARRREAEETLVVVEHAPTAAAGAGVGGRAGTGTRPPAGRAGRLAREVNGRGQPADGVLERQVQLGLEVLTPMGAGAARRAGAGAAGSTATGAPEQPAQHVAQVTEVLEPEPARSPARATRTLAAEHAAHRAELADLVVLLAPLGVADDVVGGRDLLEAFLGSLVAGVGVGVVLARQLPVRLADVLLGRAVAHPEDPVVILLEPLTLRRHRWTRPSVGHLDHRRTQHLAAPAVAGP